MGAQKKGFVSNGPHTVSPHPFWSKTNEKIYGTDEYLPKSPAEPPAEADLPQLTHRDTHNK